MFPVLMFPQFDPVVVALGPFAVRWYALAYIAALVAGWRLVRLWSALPPAVRDAYAGRGTIDSKAMKAVMKRRQDGIGGDLTKRERETLALLATGLTNEEIAERLFLSVGTVRLHVSNVLMKLHAPNRTSAAVIAIENRLTV